LKKIAVLGLILVVAALPMMMALSVANVQAPTTWNIETVDSAGNVGWHSSLALDSGGKPHISYHDAYPNDDLKYARWTGTAWSIQTVDSTGRVGYDSSLALDSWNWPHISYYDATNYDLKYARLTKLGWNIETVDSAGEVGQYTSLALDSGGKPHISYYVRTPNYDLKYDRIRRPVYFYRLGFG